MSIPPPISIPEEKDVHCMCAACQSDACQSDVYHTPTKPALVDSYDDYEDWPEDLPGLPSRDQAKLDWPFSKGVVLRYYESDVSDKHSTAVFHSRQYIHDVTHQLVYRSIEDWIASLPLVGSFYINCRNQVDQENHTSRTIEQ